MGNGHVLIVGADGYIGSVLTGVLAKAGYDISGIDTGYYSDQSLYSPNDTTIMKKDVRLVTIKDLVGVDAIICLSDLNDPTSSAYPEQTKSINLQGLMSLANKCKQAGVRRFLYASSASVYGFAGDENMSENSKLNPLTPYAECKIAIEKHLLSISDDNFRVACMRNATVYGLSPHMRFDLVINYLCGSAIADNIVRLKSDGSAWRPFVHINDLAEAFLSILRLPDKTFSNLIVNVGNGDTGNHRVADIAQIISQATGCPVEISLNNKDARSYRLNTDKLESLGIACTRDLHKEIEVMVKFLRDIELDTHLLHNDSFHRTDRIRNLLESGQVDNELYWR